MRKRLESSDWLKNIQKAIRKWSLKHYVAHFRSFTRRWAFSKLLWNRANRKCVDFSPFLPCRPKSWIEEQEMGSFLSVAKGSDEPPVFLEIHYRGSPNAGEAPLVFVGKGITFDRYLFVHLCFVFWGMLCVDLYCLCKVCFKSTVFGQILHYFKCITVCQRLC